MSEDASHHSSYRRKSNSSLGSYGITQTNRDLVPLQIDSNLNIYDNKVTSDTSYKDHIPSDL